MATLEAAVAVETAAAAEGAGNYYLREKRPAARRVVLIGAPRPHRSRKESAFKSSIIYGVIELAQSLVQCLEDPEGTKKNI